MKFKLNEQKLSSINQNELLLIILKTTTQCQLFKCSFCVIILTTFCLHKAAKRKKKSLDMSKNTTKSFQVCLKIPEILVCSMYIHIIKNNCHEDMSNFKVKQLMTLHVYIKAHCVVMKCEICQCLFILDDNVIMTLDFAFICSTC